MIILKNSFFFYYMKLIINLLFSQFQRSIWRNFAVITGIAIDYMADDWTNSNCKTHWNGSHRYPSTRNAVRWYVLLFNWNKKFHFEISQKLIFFIKIIIADNSSPMTPPMVRSFSPVNNNMCDQNQVTPMDGLSQDLPLSPMQPTQQQANATISFTTIGSTSIDTEPINQNVKYGGLNRSATSSEYHRSIP